MFVYIYIGGGKIWSPSYDMLQDGNDKFQIITQKLEYLYVHFSENK